MRKRIDRTLETLGHFVYRRAHWVTAGVLILIGIGITQIPNIEFRVSVDEFLREDDPAKIDYDAFLKRFGRDDVILLAIEPPEVFDLTFLEKLRRLHREIEENVPYLRDVKSLVNARETRGENDTLIVGDLLEDWPETPGDLESVRRRALANPLYTGFILSNDGNLTTITVEIESFVDLDTDEDAFSGFDDSTGRPADGADSQTRITGNLETAVVDAVTEIVERYEAPDFKVYIGGSPVINQVMMGSLVRDVALFTVLSICVIAGVLFVVFRQAVAVIVPLAVAVLSLAGTLAAMGTFGIPAMPISEVVPSFLLSVGVGGSVHLIVIFQQRLRAGASREDAIADALGHSGLPIIMTALTTAGGLASFMAAELTPIFIFGVVAPVGILISLLLTLFLCPALLAILPLRPQTAPENVDTFTIRLLTRLGDFSTAHAGRVLAACAILLMIALIGILQLQFSFDSLEWFPDDNPAKVASRKIDAEFGGAMGIELLIETGQENGLHDPELLQRIDRARMTSRDLEVGAVKAGKSVSIIDIVKETHQALNGGTDEAYTIPNDRRLISQELLLFENSGTDDLEDVVDSQFSLARYTIRAPMVDGSHYEPFGDELVRIFRKHIGDRAEISISGLMVVMSRSFTATIETMMRSYLIALAIITPLMMIVLGSFRLGLIAMIPNLFPIVLTLGLMGALGLPIEIFSLLIGSVALGLAVDDTIHFMHGFRRGYARTGDVEVAVRETLRTTGQALLFTSVVLSLGFLIYVFSDLVNLTNFGFLTAFAIIMAFLADVLLAPALMTVTARYSSIQTEAEDADAA
jgi:predicted RND superfamily exporter protein